MTKKIYRRFLLAVMMMLLTVFLTTTGPTQQAAVQETCEECFANCDAEYEQCVAAGRTDCARKRLLCYLSCSPVCNTPPVEPPAS